ncbi:MAG: methyl-accepting chemotaxis protein [Phycisphaeraceae bacterium]|nr:methyl-accepting chemotaxis protein [Phycisphaeraceae bacterium]
MIASDDRGSETGLLRRDSIGGRLLRAFVLMALVPVLAMLLITWWISRTSVESMQISSLKAIATLKAERLNAFATRRLQVVTALGVSPGVNAAFDHLEATARVESAVDADRAFLRRLSENYEAPDVLLINRDGEVLLSAYRRHLEGRSIAQGELRNTALAEVVRRARMQMAPEISEISREQVGERPMLIVAGPVIGDGVLRGFLAMEVAPEAIDEVVLDEQGLGRTGQTVCATIQGGMLVVTAPTRFDPDAAFNVMVPLGADRLMRLQNAARGVDSAGQERGADGEMVLGSWTHVGALGWGLGVTMETSEVFALARRQQWAAGAVALLAMIAAIVIAWRLARSISHPIACAAEASERLARGDLVTECEPVGRGEPRRLLESMGLAMRTLGSLLGRLRHSAAELEQTATEIRRTASEQEEVAHAFGASATQVAAAVTEMTGTGRELADTMSVVAEAATNAAALAGRGREGLAELDRRTGSLRAATETVARRLETIRERASAINTVITTITRVADQTNLLSINAALEAEKAGRYGLGFQVVAREINRLSEQTSEATTDIERIVVEMQESVADGVSEMGRFSRIMEEGATTVEDIGSRLADIIGVVEDLKERFQRVSEGMDAQSIGTRQIAEAMEQLSDGARRTIAAVRSFVAASEQLDRSARALAEDVDRFHLPGA